MKKLLNKQRTRRAAAWMAAVVVTCGLAGCLRPIQISPGKFAAAAPDTRAKSWSWSSGVPVNFTSTQPLVIKSDGPAAADDFVLYLKPILTTAPVQVTIKNDSSTLNETQFSGADALLQGYRPVARSRRTRAIAPSTEFYMRSSAVDSNLDIVYVVTGTVYVYPANDPDNDLLRKTVNTGQYVTISGTAAAPVLSDPMTLAAGVLVDGVDIGALAGVLQAELTGP